MKKVLIAAAIAAITMSTVQPAAAFGYHAKHFRHFKHFKHIKPPKPPAAPKQGTLGNSSTGWFPQYMFYATSCSALFLWVQALHTSQTQKRELTQKEAWTTVGNCYLPVIGGAIMGSLAQQ